MNYFVGLPWRIASLAGLLVGGLSLLSGAGAWTCLLRVVVAFVVFAAAGFGLQIVLHADPPPKRPSGPKTPDESPDEPASSGTDTQ